MKIRATGTAVELDAFRRHNLLYLQSESRPYPTPTNDIYRRYYDLTLSSGGEKAAGKPSVCPGKSP